MLAAGTEMFLFIPDDANGRILHPGKVIESDATSYVVQFDTAIAPPPGSDVNAYGEVRGKFFQQGAKVAAIREAAPKAIIAFTRAGEPVSAENRQTFRVSVISANIVAKVGKEKNCPIVDISPEGFGAIAKAELKVGTLVPVEFQHANHIVSALRAFRRSKPAPTASSATAFSPPTKRATPDARFSRSPVSCSASNCAASPARHSPSALQTKRRKFLPANRLPVAWASRPCRLHQK